MTIKSAFIKSLRHLLPPEEKYCAVRRTSFANLLRSGLRNAVRPSQIAVGNYPCAFRLCNELMVSDSLHSLKAIAYEKYSHNRRQRDGNGDLGMSGCVTTGVVTDKKKTPDVERVNPSFGFISCRANK